MDNIHEYEIRCNGEPVAHTSGLEADALREAYRYAAIYAEDGATEIFEVYTTYVKIKKEELIECYLDIGKYTISKYDADHTWIGCDGGEGGAFSTASVEAAIDAFYKANF